MLEFPSSVQSRANALAVILVACSVIALPTISCPQSPSPQAKKSLFPMEDTWWEGSYQCAQGVTDLRLKTRASPEGTVEALFEFAPPENDNGSGSGSFLLTGTFRAADGRLRLDFVRWISQPFGYAMVGLVGTVMGPYYRGTVVGYHCDEFSVLRRSTQIIRHPPREIETTTTSKATNGQNTNETAVPLLVEGGTYALPVSINNKLTLNFILDSGASDVSIPADVVLTLIRTGTLTSDDFLGTQTYRLADGSAVPSQTFRIRTLRVGDRLLENVKASVAPVKGSLLLGQSFLSRFRSWSIRNEQRVLILE